MSLLLSALYGLASNLVVLSLGFFWGLPLLKEAIANARRREWLAGVWHGVLGLTMSGFALMSFVALVGTLLIGALVVEQGVAP